MSITWKNRLLGFTMLAALGGASVAAAAAPPSDQKPTADDSKNGKSDLELTAKIRRSVIADKGLSTAAHNIKIIVESGIVTLRGPVQSTAEKMSLEKKASDIAGPQNVRNRIEIAP